MTENTNQFDRRSVLKTIGATAAVGGGLGAITGNVAATETEGRLERAYHDELRLRVAFERHGAGLRETLVEAGFVDESFDFGTVEFELDPTVNGAEPASEDRLAGVTAVEREGVPTALGAVSTSSDTHDIALFVQPERDEAYATVEPKDGDERFVVTESDVSPSACVYSECTSDCCGEGEAYREHYECYDTDCRECYVTGKSCNCSDCRCADPACTK